MIETPNLAPSEVKKKINILNENDHMGDWSPEKDCCWRLMFR